MIVCASFTAGAILSLCLPVATLIALVAWHFISIRRLPPTRQHVGDSPREPSD